MRHTLNILWSFGLFTGGTGLAGIIILFTILVTTGQNYQVASRIATGLLFGGGAILAAAEAAIKYDSKYDSTCA